MYVENFCSCIPCCCIVVYQHVKSWHILERHSENYDYLFVGRQPIPLLLSPFFKSRAHHRFPSISILTDWAITQPCTRHPGWTQQCWYCPDEQHYGKTWHTAKCNKCTTKGNRRMAKPLPCFFPENARQRAHGRFLHGKGTLPCVFYHTHVDG
jgi:hypothetical protein